MKYITLLLLVMLLATQAFGQSKKEKKAQAKAQADSAAMAAAADTVLLAPAATGVAPAQAAVGDTIAAIAEPTEMTLYQGMYDTLVAKVFKYEFDPARTSVLIDSLVTERKSAFAGLNATQASLLDTIAMLQDENLALRTDLNNVNAAAAARADRTVVIMELKQWKGLLDDQVITLTEYNALKKELLDKLSSDQ